LHFLVDTGASLSIFPFRLAKSLTINLSSLQLSSVDGSSVTVHGEVQLSMASRQLRRQFDWCFIVADIPHPIIGADFLAAHNISVSCAKMTIKDDVTELTAQCRPGISKSFAPILSIPHAQSDVS